MTDPAHQLARSREARSRFLAAGLDAGANTTSFRSAALAPDGEPWWIDAAFAGPEDASRAVVFAGSLAGGAGLAASEMQCRLLRQWTRYPATAGLRLVFLHATDPSGGQRHTVPDTREGPGAGWSDAVLAAAEARWADYARSRRGKGTGSRVSPVFQSSREGPDWVASAVTTVAGMVAEKVERALLVEIRTGLQSRGRLSAMSCHVAGSPADARVAQWFGSAAAAGTGGAAASDILDAGFAAPFHDDSLTAVIAELGIYAMDDVLALPVGTLRHKHLDSLFLPDDPNWPEAAWTSAIPFFDQAFQGVRRP